MAQIEFRHAIKQALAEELARDPRVVFFGEDVAIAGGVFQATRGLYEEFGPERVFDTPISELALSGMAFGSAVTGLRPVVEIMFGDFFPLAMDSLVNQAAKYWWLSNEQASVPLVMRSAVGGGARFAAVHSQIPAPWFMGVPGLKMVCPATPADARGLLKAAIRDDNPVLFFEHKRLYTMKGEVGVDDAIIPVGEAAIVRPGKDLTIATVMTGVHESLNAANTLTEHNVDVEVIDLRTLRPLDAETLLASVRKTGRLLVVEEGPSTGGWSSEVLALVVERGLGHLDDAWRLTMPDLPIPYSPVLEDAWLPSADRIVESVLSRQ